VAVALRINHSDEDGGCCGQCFWDQKELGTGSHAAWFQQGSNEETLCKQILEYHGTLSAHKEQAAQKLISEVGK